MTRLRPLGWPIAPFASLFICLFLGTELTYAGGPKAGQLPKKPDPNYLQDTRASLNAAFVSGQTDLARRALTTLLSALPDDPELLTLQAASNPVETDLNTLQGREESLNGSALLAQAIGNQYWVNGQWQLASQAFARAQRLAPNHPDPLYSQAICQWQLNAPEAAAKLLQQARLRLPHAISRLTAADFMQLEAALAQALLPPTTP